LNQIEEKDEKLNILTCSNVENNKELLAPLQTKVNSLIEENQRLVSYSADLEARWRQKLDEKSKQYTDMEQALIIVVS